MHTRWHTRPHVTRLTHILMGRRLWAGATGRPGPACGITRDQTRPHPRPKPPQTCARSPAARAAPPSPHASLRRPRGPLSVPQAAPRTSPSSRTRASSNSSARRTLSTLCERPLHLLVDHGRSRAVSLVAPREFSLCSVGRARLRFWLCARTSNQFKYMYHVFLHRSNVASISDGRRQTRNCARPRVQDAQ